MDSQIVAVYCLCDDLLKALYHPEDQQCRIGDAEVMTTAIVAMLYFRGNYEAARRFLMEYGYIPRMLGKSRFNRRLHRIRGLFLTLYGMLGETWKELNERSIYIIDSFPVAACDNYRILRCRLYRGEEWRGYQASKKRYFYGLKIHLMITEGGQPVEFFLTPGEYSDTKALTLYQFDLPERSKITGDKAYNDYDVEDALIEADLHLTPLRKKNSKRPLPPWVFYLMSSYRHAIETTGTLRFTYLTRGLGAAEAKTTATNDGAYTANGAYLAPPGEWQISTAGRRPNAFDVFADYRVRVNLGGQIEPLEQERPIDALVKWLSIYGLMFGGLVAVAFGAAWLFIAWKAADHPAALAVLIIPAIIAIPIGVYSIVTFTREATPGLTLTNPFLPDEASLKIGRE